MNIRIRAAALAAAASVALVLSGCSGGAGSGTDPGDVDPEGEIKPREISWLLSRPADGAVITTMKQIADEYAADHPGFSLNLITTPDRPSYIQKLRDPRGREQAARALRHRRHAVRRRSSPTRATWSTPRSCCRVLDLYDDYRPAALDYQRFDDGSLLHDPVRVRAGVLLVQHGLFEQAGVDVPETLDDFPAMCTAAARGRASPPSPSTARTSGRSSATWRTTRSALAGPDYVQELKKGERRVHRPRRRGSGRVAACARSGRLLPRGLLVDRVHRRAGPVHLGQGRDLQHRHVGAADPGNRASSTPPCATTSTSSRCPPRTDAVTAANEYVVAVGHRHGGQHQDVRPARAATS